MLAALDPTPFDEDKADAINCSVTALLKAVFEGKLEMVKQLVEQEKADPMEASRLYFNLLTPLYVLIVFVDSLSTTTCIQEWRMPHHHCCGGGPRANPEVSPGAWS